MVAGGPPWGGSRLGRGWGAAGWIAAGGGEDQAIPWLHVSVDDAVGADVGHGHGEMHHDCGNVYVGQFEHDQRAGVGTYTFACGDAYVGEWKPKQIPNPAYEDGVQLAAYEKLAHVGVAREERRDDLGDESVGIGEYGPEGQRLPPVELALRSAATMTTAFQRAGLRPEEGAAAAPNRLQS